MHNLSPNNSPVRIGTAITRIQMRRLWLGFHPFSFEVRIFPLKETGPLKRQTIHLLNTESSAVTALKFVLPLLCMTLCL